jgi:ketosteroid isomerase-like protein
MTTLEVANKLVDLCRAGKNMDAVHELYAENIVSVEPAGSRHERVEGKANVIQKENEFFSMVEEVHLSEVSDPVVADGFFSVRMIMEVSLKGMGRMKMDEVCVYGVTDGKISFEQFFFRMNN